MSKSEYSEEVLASLTDEERAALEEDDGGDDTHAAAAAAAGGAEAGADTGKGAAEPKGGEGGETKMAGDDAAAAAATAAAEADKGKTTGEAKPADGSADGKADAAVAEAPEVKERLVPLLTADAPADADAKLKDIGEKKSTLLDQFDNGDITAKEYQTQLDALSKEERTIENAVFRAKMAADMKSQQEMGNWLKQVDDFTKNSHPEYSKSRSRWMALDSFVKEIATDPKNASLSGAKVLEMAHKMVVDDLGDVTPPKTGDTKGNDAKADDGKPLKGSEIVPPKTLAKVPASDNNEINDGKFAALDRLAETDPIELEERMMRMSESDRDEYLASRG